MKKLVFLMIFISSIFAANIKQNYFIGISSGLVKFTQNTSKETYFGGKIGLYFYDTNPYLISNRLYLDGEKSTFRNSDILTAHINLDWIWNQIPYVKPFIGVSAGYLYESSNPTGLYGFNGGLLFYIGHVVELEVGAKIDHPLENTQVWPDNLKKVYGSINFSF